MYCISPCWSSASSSSSSPSSPSSSITPSVDEWSSCEHARGACLTLTPGIVFPLYPFRLKVSNIWVSMKALAQHLQMEYSLTAILLQSPNEFLEVLILIEYVSEQVLDFEVACLYFLLCMLDMWCLLHCWLNDRVSSMLGVNVMVGVMKEFKVF